MQDTFVSTMQQGLHPHLKKVFWNGVGCVKQVITVQVDSQKKYHAHQEHIGELLAASHYVAQSLNKLSKKTLVRKRGFSKLSCSVGSEALQ